MNEKLLTALEEISSRHIEEAANRKGLRHSHAWLRAAAAVLALVLFLTCLPREAPTVSAQELVTPAAYTPPKKPYREDLSMTPMQDFWGKSFQVYLSATENTVWSPVSTYLSLAALAQLSSGSTRQEILRVLGTETVDLLQKDAQSVWERVYADDETVQRLCANSIWLDQTLEYREENLSVLGKRYYTAVYQTKLNTDSAAQDIQAWMNEKAGGLLNDLSPAVPPASGNRVLALASTFFVDETWIENFDPSKNRNGVFHAPDGDTDCTYLFAELDTTDYARGENYSAVSLSTSGGCRFWMILPDEGIPLSELVESGNYLDTVMDPDPEGKKVNLTMPKFDIHSSMDLSDGLKVLGIREVFSVNGGDFSDTLSLDAPICVGQIRQSARIIVNETGIRAGSGTFVDLISLGIDEPVQLVLDRPFLFVLTLEQLPLLAGVVAAP